MAKRSVQLPDIDLIRGIVAQGTVWEIQYACVQPGPFPQPEDVGPDTFYKIQLSIAQARTLHVHLTHMLATSESDRA